MGYYDPPNEGCIDPSPLQESVWSLLEDAGVDDDTMKKIDALIGEWEAARHQQVIEAQIERAAEP